MGRDKASLPFGAEAMLQRVVRVVGEVIDFGKIAVVTAPTQEIPELPNSVILARDTDEFLGPLAGMAVGLRALQQFTNMDAVYVTGCDFPLVAPTFIKRMFSLLDDCDAAVPIDGEQRHVLAAVYRPGVLAQVEALLAKDQFRLQALLAEISVRETAAEGLRAVDPLLNSLRNVNCDAEYRAALNLANVTE